MTKRNIRMSDDRTRFERWRGSHEYLHAEPRQTVGKTYLVFKTRQSGMTQ